MTKNNEQIIKLDGSFTTIEQAKKAGLLRNKEIFEGFIVDNITIKDIEFDEEKFDNLIVNYLTRDDLFNLVLAYRKELKCKELILKKIKEKYKNVCKVCPKNIKCNECSVKDTLDMFKRKNNQ